PQEAGAARGLGDAALDPLQRPAGGAERQPASETPVEPTLTQCRASEQMAAIEGLLQNWIAEQREGDSNTAGVLNAIEEGLGRILDRIDAIEVAQADPLREETDGLAIESDRLAEAYAAGARVLAIEPLAAQLDAADYLAPLRATGRSERRSERHAEGTRQSP